MKHRIKKFTLTPYQRKNVSKKIKEIEDNIRNQVKVIKVGKDDEEQVRDKRRS